MKKVLIITYYWPPGGGASVQRWLKFTKYLPENEWQPVMFVPKNPSYPIIDEDLMEQVKDIPVIKQKIWEPYGAYKKISGKKEVHSGFLDEGKGKLSFKEKTSRWIRGNFFIPDARKFWIKPSVKRLSKILKEEQYDAIVSSGPPHSTHMIALRLKEKFNLPWLADFRDPWTSMDYYQQMYISKKSDARHHAMEKAVVTKADKVVVVGPFMKKEFEEKYNRPVEVLPTGYDPSMYDSNIRLNSKETPFHILHVGSLQKSRNPLSLWKTIQKWKKEEHPILKEFCVKLIGKIDNTVINSIKEHGIDDFVELMGYVSHREAIDFQQKAPVLGLFIDNIENAEFVVTSKIYEYIGAGRPVLCIGPEKGDIKMVMDHLNNSFLVEFDDQKAIEQALLAQYKSYKNNELVGGGGERFSISQVTEELTTHLNDIVDD